MVRNVTVAATQFACTANNSENIAAAEKLVRAAAADGANVILLQELFEGLYWCQDQEAEYFSWAAPVCQNPLLQHFSALAAELRVVLPISFFERANQAYFNSVAVLDTDGTNLGVYRKSHIPDGPGYQEKFYFSPGDTGFRVFDTRVGRLGVAVCWDQWFPEAARAMVLQGAEMLLYPTAIGSEPRDPTCSSYAHWCRTMQGHAAANMVPVVASNRIGHEVRTTSDITFYGGSFIAGQTGNIMAQVGATEIQNGAMHPCPDSIEGFVVGHFDLDACASQRAAWGLFRDRRPDLYRPLLTLDGANKPA
ncbi:carbon-nitrogen hydrolase [Haematococcus lacustris]